MVQTIYHSPGQRLDHTRSSPRKNDSPSRQLYSELQRSLEQLAIHDQEKAKVHVYQRRAHHEALDARDMASTKAHVAAIDAATAKHDAIREEAEAVLRRHLREEEEKQRRKQEEERQRHEREAREKAERERLFREEAERKAREEQERKEAEEAKQRRAAEEKARAEAEAEAEERKKREADAKKQQIEKAQAEKDKADQESAAKAKAEKEATERQAAQVQQSKPAPTTSLKGAEFYSASTHAETIHQEYLDLHKKLKNFRKDFWEQAKQNKPLKTAVGDMRRSLRTSVGQLTDDKVGNRKASDRVKTAILTSLSSVPSPMVPVNDFLPPHLQIPSDGNNQAQIPTLTIYLLNIFSKAIIAAFTSEVSVNPRAAEPIGTLTAQIFSMAELQFPPPSSQQPQQPQRSTQTSLISILISKYHRVAPILFGISAPETTTTGRNILGWRTEGSPPNKKDVSIQRHHERMTGLGAGFASIALRNFSRTKLSNPYPPHHFWQSLSYIVNTPSTLIQTSHLLLIKSMLDGTACDRVILFFGDHGIAAMREALIHLPGKLPAEIAKSPAARSIGLMVEAWAESKHFRFD